MTVIQGIQTVVKIAPIVYRVGKIAYRGFKSTRKGQQWLSRHPKAVKTATVAAGAGGLLLDLTNVDYSAIPSPFAKSRKVRQTRDNIYGTKSGRFYGSQRYPRYCRPKRRQR